MTTPLVKVNVLLSAWFDFVLGYDETIVPLDFGTAGMITDDLIHEIMVQPLPTGVCLTAISDCCHSGSILDLPFSFVFDQKVDNRAVVASYAMAEGRAFAVGRSKEDVPINAQPQG